MIICGLCFFLTGGEGGPGAGDHVVQDGGLPAKFFVGVEEWLGEERFAAGVAYAGDEGHFCGHGGVDDFSGDGSAGIVGGRVPHVLALAGGVLVAAEAALVGVDFVFVGVE